MKNVKPKATYNIISIYNLLKNLLKDLLKHTFESKHSKKTEMSPNNLWRISLQHIDIFIACTSVYDRNENM